MYGLSPPGGPHAGRGKLMKKASKRSSTMRRQYDFSRGVRGKYVDRLPRKKSGIVLAPDVAERFRTSESVNNALRILVDVADKVPKPPTGGPRRFSAKEVPGRVRRLRNARLKKPLGNVHLEIDLAKSRRRPDPLSPK